MQGNATVQAAPTSHYISLEKLANQASPRRSFAALRHPGFRIYVITSLLAMMADNIEHVISYWVAFSKFHSPALGGFAVVSHWLPFLLLSVPIGVLAERYDPRRMIQAGMALFMLVSLGWAYFFVTDTLRLWHAMLLLALHGCAAALFVVSSQVLLHDIVGPDLLPSAVRLSATARYLGMLAGPAVGGGLLLALGPSVGIFINAAIYLPLLLWLSKAPYGPRFRVTEAMPRRPIRGLADLVQGIRVIRKHGSLLAMTVLMGSASFFIGNSYQAQMPGLAGDLGHRESDASYSMLLAADAAGALLAAVVLESRGQSRPRATVAIVFGLMWCASLAGFAMTHNYWLALGLLLLTGVFELLFSSMAQTIVQLNAPAASRGQVIGAFSMASLGLRVFSGVTVGLIGNVTGVHESLAGSALGLAALLCLLLMWRRKVSELDVQTERT